MSRRIAIYGILTKTYKDTKLDAICPNLLVNLRKHKNTFHLWQTKKTSSVSN